MRIGWYTRPVPRSLAPYIGLDEADEEEIQEERTSIRQKVKLMRVWKRKHGEEATYLRFVKGCEQLQRRDLVEAVCNLVTGIDASGGSGRWLKSRRNNLCMIDRQIPTP